MSLVDQWSTALIAAMQAGEKLPVPAGADAISLGEAYAVQRQVVDALSQGRPAAGYKAALSGEAARELFGANDAVAGVLLADPQEPGVVQKSGFQTLMLETELAWRVGRPISRPLEGETSLRTHIDAVAPAIELADLGFVSGHRPTMTSLVAANAAAKGWILGAVNLLTPGFRFDANREKVSLRRGDELLHEGHGSDAFGDQWAAISWMVNQLLAQGHEIEAGQWFMTGSLGALQPGKEGEYVASYATLGEIRFSVL